MPEEVSILDELKQILIAHARRYPAMEPTDAVKLIYQNEFGGGHLIRDEAACIGYLRREYERTEQLEDAPLTEAIGNGLVRVHLQALKAYGYPPEALADDFIRSASLHTGSVESFLEKLEILRQTVREGYFRFSLPVLKDYLRSYAEAGYPMVSHSEAYRRAYAPAYRIVLETIVKRTNSV